MLVTEDNADQYPVPVGCFVKWATWRRWKDPVTGIEHLDYEIRATDPLPNDVRKVLRHVREEDINESKRAFISVPVADESVQTFAYRTQRYAAVEK